MRISLAVLCLLALGFNSAYALEPITIEGRASSSPAVQQSLDLLTNCEWEHITHAGLETIRSVKHGALGNDDIAGVRYYTLATSLHHKGIILFDSSVIKDKSVVLHEMGHWWAWDVMFPDYSSAWHQAIDLDVAELKKHPELYGKVTDRQKDNAYISSPWEAAAEEFAYLKLGSDIYHKYSDHDIEQFPHSLAMLKQIMEVTCPR